MTVLASQAHFPYVTEGIEAMAAACADTSGWVGARPYGAFDKLKSVRTTSLPSFSL